MTKSTITRERLEQLANFKGAPVTRQEEQELARMALAAMDSEPAGKPFMYGIADPDGNAYIDDFCVSEDLGLVEDAVTELNYDREEGDELCYSAIPLYRHAQPVPEEIPIETATIIAYGLPTTNIGKIFKAGHDTCRAAMLAAAPQKAINALIPLVSRDEQEVK